MNLNVTVNAEGLARAAEEVADKAGISQVRVLRALVAGGLKTAIERTPTQKPARVSQRARSRAGRAVVRAQQGGDAKAYQGQRPGTIRFNTRESIGRAWVMVKGRALKRSGGKSDYLQNYHFLKLAEDFKPVANSPAVGAGLLSMLQFRAAQFAAVLRREMELGKRAVGLAANSLVQAADALSMDLSSFGRMTAKLRRAIKAVPSDGRARQNGAGAQRVSGDRATIVITNSLPWNDSIGLRGNVERALKGQEQYVAEVFRREGYPDLEAVARRHPGMKVT